MRQCAAAGEVGELGANSLTPAQQPRERHAVVHLVRHRAVPAGGELRIPRHDQQLPARNAEARMLAPPA